MSFKSPSPLPPHPATVVQRRSPHPATLASERPPHPAATFHCCPGALTTSRTAQRSTFGPDTDWYCPNCGAANKAYSETPPFGKCQNCKKTPAYSEWSKAPKLSKEKEETITEALSKEATKADWSALYPCFDQWLTKTPNEVVLDQGDSLFCNVGGSVKQIRSAALGAPTKAVAMGKPKGCDFTHLGMLVATIEHAEGPSSFIGVAANAYLEWDQKEPLSRWQWNGINNEKALNVCHTEQLCLCALHTYLLTLSNVESITLAWLTQKKLCDWCVHAANAFESYWSKTAGIKQTGKLF